MRPFTKIDRVLSFLLPSCAGITLSFPLIALVTGPHWFWSFYGVTALLLPACVYSRIRGRHRYAELERIAAQRGWRIKQHHHLLFTETEVDEIGLIKGQFMARALRLLGSGVEHT